MARYKHTEAESGQGMFLTVNLKEQLLPGTFEYMLNELVGTKIDVSIFDENYQNDEKGAGAIPPRVLIKLISYGYLKGVKSSRRLEELCRNNVTAKALAEDMEPHWTTIADFISTGGEKFKGIFAQVLMYCNELELIGGQDYAVDGDRLPSNASLEMTGKRKDLEKRLAIYRRMAEKHIEKHQRRDEAGDNSEASEKRYQERQRKLNKKIEALDNFIKTMKPKKGNGGKEITSNVTDNESAMIHSPKGYIQGYIGMAVADSKKQIIVSAKAVGSANEGAHFPDMLKNALSNVEKAGVKKEPEKKPVIMADSNYFSEENLKAGRELGVETIIADGSYKSRLGKKEGKTYRAEDFTYNEEDDNYECPAGKKLERTKTRKISGRECKLYKADAGDCGVCPLKEKCVKSKKKSRKSGRSLSVTENNSPGGIIHEHLKNLNTVEWQDKYARRMQIIEPVFANISFCKGLNRFSLRGQEKVNGQWLLYCIVHNLGKCLKGYNKGKGYA